MKKSTARALKVAYVSLFIAACAAFGALTPVFGGYDGTENKSPAKTPELIVDGALNTAAGTEFESWFSERFAFRSPLVTANALIRANLFSSSAEDDVIIGSDGWLYYAGTAADYTGERAISVRGINALAIKLGLMAEYVESVGGRFVFAAAPNKNTVVPNHMPPRYVKSTGAGNLDRLYDAVASYPDINAPDLRDALTESDYQKRDTHWNGGGALKGYISIIGAAGREPGEFAGAPLVTTNDFAGDLDKMLYPALELYDERVGVNYAWSYKFTSRYRSEDDITITSECGAGDGTALVFRDSFCRAMIPFFAQDFSSCVFSRATPYRFDELGSADVVVVEIAERNLSALLEQETVFPAPERDESAVNLTAADATVDFGKAYGMTLLRGEIAGGVPEGARIYVRADGRLYECSPTGDASFCAYIEGGCGDAEVYIGRRRA